MNRNEIMKLQIFFLLQGLHQKPDNKSYFLETPIFLILFSERFHLLLKFLQFIDNKSYDEARCGSKRLYKLNPILDHLNDKVRSVYTPQCDVLVDESLVMQKTSLSWKVYIPSKCARCGTKPSELCDDKSGYV
jgi:DNA-directed RNA polymerase subunit RPC12/RpoP